MNPKIAVGQINCKLADVPTNLRRIRDLSEKIAKQEADIVCFPELVTTGYSLYEKWLEVAEPVPGPMTDKLGSMAREFGFYLIAGMPERTPESKGIFNSAVLISPQGEVTGVYRKVHLWNKERIYFTPGNEFPLFRTKIGLIGIGICFDLEFPETSRIMAMSGAEMIFFPSADMKPFQRYVDVYVPSRAAENGVFVAFSNLVGHEGKTVFFGGSQIVSPDCRVLAHATATKAFAVAQIDLASLSKVRERLPYLKQRRPAVYSVLQSEAQIA